MKTIKYWLRKRIKYQEEHIKFLQWELELQKDLKDRWEALYKETQK